MSVITVKRKPVVARGQHASQINAVNIRVSGSRIDLRRPQFTTLVEQSLYALTRPHFLPLLPRNMAIDLSSLTTEQLKKAVELREQIDALQQELAELGAEQPTPSPVAVPAHDNGRRGKRTMSPEAKAKIAAAQKARWAKQRGEAAPAPAEKPARKKKTMTSKALKALAKARAARWAKK